MKDVTTLCNEFFVRVFSSSCFLWVFVWDFSANNLIDCFRVKLSYTIYVQLHYDMNMWMPLFETQLSVCGPITYQISYHLLATSLYFFPIWVCCHRNKKVWTPKALVQRYRVKIFLIHISVSTSKRWWEDNRFQLFLIHQISWHPLRLNKPLPLTLSDDALWHYVIKFRKFCFTN